MECAQAAAEQMLDRTGLSPLLASPPTLWKAAHY
jgi:hypothetical protein